MSTLNKMKTFTLFAFLAIVAGAQAASVYQTAKDNGLTILVAAVDAAGLKDVLDDPKFKSTVFAPTNEAFEELLKDLGLTAEELLSQTELVKNVLLYHVLPNRIYKSKVPRRWTGVKTLLGEFIRVKKSGGWHYNGKPSTVAIRYVPKERKPVANVVIANVKANRSVVHVIDKVMVPPL